MKISLLIKNIFVVFIFSSGTSCSGNIDQNNNVSKDAFSKGSTHNSIPALKLDSTTIASFFIQHSLLSPLKKELQSFYDTRQYGFVWFDKKGLIKQAGNLYNHMQDISSEGLPDKMLYKNEFKNLMKNDGMDSTNNPSVITELMLTAQYFTYAKNVWSGLNQKDTKDLKWYLPRNKISYAHLLDSLISGRDLLDSAPVYRQYLLLKNYLKLYKAIQAGEGFPLIKADKKIYKKGDSSATIIGVRKWLFAAGDLNANNNSYIFDDTLEAGVKKFQQRIGQKEDGVVAPTFVNEMNVPVSERIQQIIVNMERSRWVPVSLVTDYLVINIPEYKLHAYENNNLVWSMNVVVGKPANQTVIFNGNLKYIVFSPYWNVPSSILQKEILPGIQKDRNYLAEHDMEWNGNSVRQKPGSNNSLGLVKFLFPNSYNIYLHDTPAKSLFGESNRAFSHGCIRLSDARKLAIYLLRNDTIWTSKKIDVAMHTGKEQFVTLKNEEPVFIAYFTSWVDRQGRLNFRKDAYGRDKPLAAMLLNKPAL